MATYNEQREQGGWSSPLRHVGVAIPKAIGNPDFNAWVVQRQQIDQLRALLSATATQMRQRLRGCDADLAVLAKGAAV